MSREKTHRRDFLKQAASLGLALSAPRDVIRADGEPKGAEWRNKQSGMAYRRLGRTGIMVSEVVSGGDPIRTDNYEHLNLAIDMGLNYLDMAPAYGRGDCETAYGKLLAGKSSLREKVFLTTKVSGFSSVRDGLYREIFETLPGEKQGAILERAKEILAERGVAKPGYFLEYFPGQRRSLDPAYLSNAMAPDYGHKVDGLKKQGKVRFLGVTAHNDPAGILRKAVDLGHYDLAMIAYNIVNGGYVEEAIRQARAKDVGVIAMKVAMAVATHHKELQPTPQWRIDKVNRIVPGDMKPPMKAYIWTLQNPNVSAVISNLWDKTFIRENLSVAGKKVDLQPA